MANSGALLETRRGGVPVRSRKGRVPLTIVREREVALATPKLRITREQPFVLPHGQLWNLHSHSQFSHRDALPEVKDMVKTVAGFGQPALGLTDHGNVAGSVQLYTGCRKAGLLPFPGSELYVVTNREAHVKAMNAKGETPRALKRHHMCVVAYTTRGYENLVNLSTLSNKNFFNKPIVDHADLAILHEQGLLEGIAATSGCFFSLTSQAVVGGDLDAARSLIATYAGWFPRFYVELQNHRIEHDEEGWDDDRLASTLLQLATELGVPCVLTQDAHYCTPEERATHDILKRIVAFGPEADDAVFPGDGFHLADDDWFRSHHDRLRLEAGLGGLNDLLGAHDLKIRELDSYSYNIPFTVADPDESLSVRCQQALVARGITSKRYLERLNDELVVIRDTGFAGYLLLVAEVTDWCREHRVFFQARGSAAGSIVCWLLGITGPDPVKYGLSLGRFISRDRTKPPDIDLDIEYDRRQDLIAWLRGRFAVQHIGTWIKYSLAGEEETEEGGQPQGSLRVSYFARLNAIHAKDKDWKAPSWAEISAEDKRDLYVLDKASALSSYGVHPAGLVVTTTAAEQEKLIPLMQVASSSTMVSQYDMGDVEQLGVVKLDVLGLKTLAVLNRAMTNMGRDVLDGLDWVPLSDAKTFTAISNGDTDGVFQLEGGSARRGCRELRPTKLADIVAAMALFRPATMNSGATQAYLDRKHKVEPVPKRHEIIERHTKHTLGIMLFQEQVQEILRALGMGADDLTAFLKAIKASQKDEIEKAERFIAESQKMVRELCDRAGMTEADFTWLWGAIEGYSAYGFNQAHSTVYGITAYWCAYLSVHYPLDFFAALLAVAAQAGTKRGKEKAEDIYRRVARRRGLRILRAHANLSGLTYSVNPDRKAIRSGLVSVSGVGDKQAAAILAKRPAGGWQSLEQLCRDVYVKGGPVTGIKPYLESQDHTVGTIGKLWKAGAFECFEEVPQW